MPSDSKNDRIIENAFKAHQSDLQVEGSGRVVTVLADDTKGDRHQRLILELDSGHTILVAHNIDVSDRIDPISVNDKLSFYGEYEWTEKGGVLHWTHPDSEGKHIAGWLKKI